MLVCKKKARVPSSILYYSSRKYSPWCSSTHHHWIDNLVLDISFIDFFREITIQNDLNLLGTTKTTKENREEQK